MIEQSSSIKELANALLKAQAELGGVKENAVNPFFKSKYADLGEHINTIKPAFQKHGLVISQFLTGNGDEMGVTTMLMHESGEWLKSTAIIPLEAEKGNSKAQTAGKAISYLRRYALAAVANVYSGDDNDGNIEKPKSVPSAGQKKDSEKPIPAKKNGKAKNTAEWVVELTDIDSIPHAANWLTLMAQNGVAVTQANAEHVRDLYNEQKKAVGDEKAPGMVKQLLEIGA